MCGIAGAVFWDGVPIDEAMTIVRDMTAALAHRGPDGEGVVQVTVPEATRGPVAVLGHRRLAIIDLSGRAHQPMTSDRDGIGITYNGEVYDFRALRQTLKSAGRTFRSESDTEVVLQGYQEWGVRVVDRLRGMFAFGIWDGRRSTLLLSRDRLGIKPLYVHRTPHSVLFASEIRALLASKLIPRRLDLSVLDQFLAYQTVPAPRTLVDGVQMLAPGHLVEAGENGFWRDERYWDLLGSADADAAKVTHREEAKARIAKLLEESVALHLVSDVDVGVFLSGGIDSSAIAGLIREGGRLPRTFTVTCPNTAFDEAEPARLAAKAFDSQHTEIVLTQEELVRQLPEALAGVDHPSGDGINTFVVSRAVRAAGIKVALSGVGGDEFFGGYPSFHRMEKMASLGLAWRHSPAAARRAAAAAVRAFGGSSVATKKTAALLETDGTVPQAFPVMRQMFSPEQRQELLTRAALDAAAEHGDPYVALLQSAAAGEEAETMQFVSYAEARTYMHDVLLRDTDQMSMRHGLEIRVPLLDHRLVEYVMGLPDAIKRPNGYPKRLLMESLASGLPSDIVDRPKQGFVLPFDPWMRHELKPLCEHHLGPEGLQKLGIVQASGMQSVWNSFLSRDGRVTWSRPWTLVALSSWIEQLGLSA
jgi:asparagine synthase (glutamine-hydrolysing)